jgi:pimeloyl-ACP methyl ester carboxylesterase
MYQNFAPADFSAPSLSLLLSEAGVVGAWARGIRYNQRIADAHRGDGRPVMILPGFMVSGARMAFLRKTLDRAGYRTFDWGLGRNLGVTADMLDRFDVQIDAIEREAKGPITLIGWSLGGLIAREYAKRAPHRIAQVITMGSPFSGDPRANNAWRVYEWVTKHPVDAPPIETQLSEKPPVPTYALWSRRDGIVAPASACGRPGEADESIEVPCGHLAFACAPEVVEILLTLLKR